LKEQNPLRAILLREGIDTYIDPIPAFPKGEGDERSQYLLTSSPPSEGTEGRFLLKTVSINLKIFRSLQERVLPFYLWNRNTLRYHIYSGRSLPKWLL
jgi:hypothetical protein